MVCLPNYEELLDAIENIRRIIVHNLDVRAKRSKRAEKLGKIPFGGLVTIIKKEKKWLQIELPVGNGEPVIGWIYSKYARRI